jgi:hypothetical protein
MQKLRVALALLYIFLSNIYMTLEYHNSFAVASNQAELFKVKKQKGSKLAEEVFGIFLKECYELKLTTIKKEINFVMERKCIDKLLVKRSAST